MTRRTLINGICQRPETEMTHTQIATVRKIVAAILDGIKAAGDLGAPADVLHAALMSHGCSRNQCLLLMGIIERDGFITSDGGLYRITPAGAAFAAESTTGRHHEHRVRHH